MSKSKVAPPGPSKGTAITRQTPAVVAALPEPPAPLRVRLGRFLILTAGVVLTHFVLFAPSLLGFKVLLPLEALASFTTYLPKTPEYASVKSPNIALSDQVLQFEFQRRFAAQELRAGRLPLWDPYHYCGAPFVVPFLTPFNFLYYLIPNYVALAWTHVLVALVAAGGAYLFFRRAQGLGFWPSVIAAWCFPLTGFFQYWFGFYLTFTIAFFPWLLVAVDETVRRPGRWGGPVLAVVTGLILISGALDLAGQALLAAGLFAVWRLGEGYLRDWLVRPLVAPVVALTAGWALGFLLAAPYWMHLTEYGATGMRLQRRASNQQVERKPEGFTALPLMVAPYIEGTTWRNWPFLSKSNNLQESAAQAYAGLFAALVLAPIGLARRRQLSLNLFWIFLSIVASAWILNLPILTIVLQLPGLNLMSHNRFLFVVCFAVLSLAATGMDVLLRGEVAWRPAYLVPLGLIAVLGLWCAAQAANIDAAVTKETRVSLGDRLAFAGSDPALLAVARGTLQQYSFETAAFCGAALLLWVLVLKAPPRVALAVVGVALVGDLLWTMRGQNPQCDPSLYYPDIPALSQLAEAPPGRVVGMSCLPALLPQRFDLWDVRGYDSVDPFRVVNLLLKLKDQSSPAGTPGFDYAAVQWWWPMAGKDRQTGKTRLLPAVNMLGLRYLIFRGTAFRDVITPKLIESDDYWVFENTEALPRAFVPERVEVLKDPVRVLAKLTDPESAIRFDPRAVAYAETDPNLTGAASGSAEVLPGETPGEVHVEAKMETPGLLVLADQWNAGWKAYLNGTPLTVHRVNYALRGVAIPAGRSEVVFRYEPAGWARGVKLFVAATVLVIGWAAAAAWLARRPAAPAPAA